MPVSVEMRRALELFESGRRREAEQITRGVLAHDPDDPDALHLLGILALDAGHPNDALRLVGKACTLRPQHAPYQVTLGQAYAGMHQFLKAEEHYRAALIMDSGSAAAYNNLGIALKRLGRLEEAVLAYREATRRDPRLMAAYFNGGVAHAERGDFTSAVQEYRRALELAEAAVVHTNLGLALEKLGQLPEAILHCQRAVVLEPDNAEMHNNLGVVLARAGHSTEAVASLRRALALDPVSTAAHVNLGTALADAGRLEESLEAYRAAVKREPGAVEALNGLGNALRDAGRAPEAVEHFRRARRVRPGYQAAWHNELSAMQFCPGVNAASLLEAHRTWGKRLPVPAELPTPTFAWPRIFGFVSADFRTHPVGTFTIGLLEALASRNIDTFLFSDTAREDALTERFRKAAKRFETCLEYQDSYAAKIIHAAEVDVLFDLSGHTAGNRLGMFALRGAPLQIAWAGYAGTTGVPAMDCILADRHHVPEGAESGFTEKVLRMPHGYVTFDPPAAPAVGALPARSSGGVTFGCFNAPAKLNAGVYDLWARILKRVPASRLFLKYRGMDDAAVMGPLHEAFAERGVESWRVLCEGWSPQRELLDAYNRVDVALDPFPYSGGITTCEALWMGVPVVTWPGETLAGRHSLSHLSTAGWTEGVACDADDYVERAVRLATDLPRLAGVRESLRPLMAASPLCDPDRFAADLLELVKAEWTARQARVAKA